MKKTALVIAGLFMAGAVTAAEQAEVNQGPIEMTATEMEQVVAGAADKTSFCINAENCTKEASTSSFSNEKSKAGVGNKAAYWPTE